MEHGEHHLQGRLLLLLVIIYRDTASVILYRNGIVFVDNDIDLCTIAGQCFID